MFNVFTIDLLSLLNYSGVLAIELLFILFFFSSIFRLKRKNVLATIIIKSNKNKMENLNIFTQNDLPPNENEMA
jgi:hypothetical protein